MISPEALAVTYGLSSAMVWGAADFTGGLATRRSHVLTVILFSQITGVFFLVSLAMLFSETLPPSRALIWGGCAGITGALGLIAFYQGLANGRMAVVAPVSAVVTAILPIVFSALNEGLPKAVQLAGFAIAVIAVWFLSKTGTETRIRISDLYLPAAAGMGFGLFFIFIDRAGASAVFWPLVAARCASLVFLAALTVFIHGRIGVPAKSQFPFIAASGILDVGGNAFFVLATQSGRLDISAVLASLYPTATVFLAWSILKEKLVPQQWIGVAATLVALVLVSV